MTSRVASVLGLALLAGGCGASMPADYPRPDYTTEYLRKHLLIKEDAQGNQPFEITPEADQQIATALRESGFSTPWRWDDADLSDEDRSLVRGEQLYRTHCIHCHGITGNGNGPTAVYLDPRPRDYRRGIFKWKSTGTRTSSQAQAKPTRDDLKRIITEGASGTSMPPFSLLPENEIDDLVSYVIFLSKRGNLERRLLLDYEETKEVPDADTVAQYLEEINAEWSEAAQTLIVPQVDMPRYAAGSPEYDAALKRGKALFLSNETKCYQCHGMDGKADPAQIAADQRKNLINDWGYDLLPRNLTLGLYHGGRRPIDIYRRIHNGIAGTGMPAQSTTLQPAQIWDLVYFVRALPYRSDLLTDAALPVAIASAGSP
jgi:mono/diheme cytochrome c family protein